MAEIVNVVGFFLRLRGRGTSRASVDGATDLKLFGL